MSTWLITGANRGLGLALLWVVPDGQPARDVNLSRTALAKRDGLTIVAAVRTPSLFKPPTETGKGTRIVVQKLDSLSETDPQDLALALQKEGIDSLDVVIANAGISGDVTSVAGLTTKNFQEVMQVNVMAPILLFQACLPFLKQGAKFIYMSSGAGTTGWLDKLDFPMGAYGASKCLGNNLFRKAHFEHPDLIIIPLHPGKDLA